LEIEYNDNPRYCIVCNTKISFYDRFNKTKFCSRSCAATHNNTGQIRSKKPPKTSFDPHARYENYISRWLKGDETGSNRDGGLKLYIRRYLFDLHDGKCQKCGWCEINPVTGKSPLNVEHRDGDSTNHRPENLDLLCPNCHSITPTFGSLNRGKGREQRRLYRHNAISEGRTPG
jgi:hypothetical protein